jgi:hypothetical protein
LKFVDCGRLLQVLVLLGEDLDLIFERLDNLAKPVHLRAHRICLLIQLLVLGDHEFYRGLGMEGVHVISSTLLKLRS